MTRKSGFTLIELIIAITILGLLAVALLAALDPIEQFNKARDTATRNTALEIHNAMLRYNASKDAFPTWVSAVTSFPLSPTGNRGALIADLINTGELKSNFIQAAGSALDRISVYNNLNGIFYTCFRPVSKQFRTEAGLFDVTGFPNMFPSPGLTCAQSSAATTGRDHCAYCAQ
jgi:prepilin-type N-terminal cleavage/methylation domain-containing protein